MVLTSLDSGKEQIRSNRSILHQQAIIAALFGLLIWSITPFITKKPVARYLSLIFSIGCGTTALLTGIKLEKNKLLFHALQKAEEDDYLHRIASLQFTQQRQWEALAEGSAFGSQLVPELPPSELMEPHGNWGSEGSGSGSGSSSLLPPELKLELWEAVEAGKSDTYIIKSILGMTGRKFAEGKEILQKLKEEKENDKKAD